MDAITPAKTAIPAIGLASGSVVDFLWCLVGISFVVRRLLIAVRVLDSLSFRVILWGSWNGGAEPLESDLGGMPSFSATSIEKSFEFAGQVLSVIRVTTCARQRPQAHVLSGDNLRGTCH